MALTADQTAWLQSIVPEAQQASAASGVSPYAIMAQTAVATNYGANPLLTAGTADNFAGQPNPLLGGQPNPLLGDLPGAPTPATTAAGDAIKQALPNITTLPETLVTAAAPSLTFYTFAVVLVLALILFGLYGLVKQA